MDNPTAALDDNDALMADQLVSAAQFGELDAMASLLDRGVDVNATSSRGETALTQACASSEENGVEAVEFLLKKGADVNLKERNGKTPLIYSAENDCTSAMRILLNVQGCDINAQDKHQNTAVCMASFKGHVASVRLLVDNSADVNMPDDDGFTPLHWACDKVEITRLLLKAGADANQMSKEYGQTPFELACIEHEWATARILVQEGCANVDIVNKDGRTCLIMAVEEHNDLECVRFLLDMGADVNLAGDGTKSPLMASVEATDQGIMPMMLQHGANVNWQNKEGLTALMSAACKGCEYEARLLIDNSADVNMFDNSGKTALAYAAGSGMYDPALAQLLLTAGADPNLGNGKRSTPLCVAAEDPDDDVSDLIRLLAANGADVNAAGSTDRLTPLMVAAADGCIGNVELLLELGANLGKCDECGEAALAIAAQHGQVGAVKVLLNAGAIVDAPDRRGATALAIAAQCGHVQVINALLNAGASVDAADLGGMTALYRACEFEQNGAVKMLLQRGASANATRTSDGASLLHIAVWQNVASAVRGLMKSGANHHLVHGKRAFTPLQLAAFLGYKETVRVLLKHGASPPLPSKMTFLATLKRSTSKAGEKPKDDAPAGSKRKHEPDDGGSQKNGKH